MRVLLMVAALSLQLPAEPWVCPMHPDVRASEEGKCPRCGMALVVMRPDTYEPYLLDAQRKVPIAAGRPVELSLALRHPETRARITDYLLVHERPAHVFVVSDDLGVFEHVHPDPPTDGTLRLTWQPPRPGRYHFFLDVVPSGALPQLLETVVVVPGTPGERASLAPQSAALVQGVAARSAVEEGDLFAGRWSRLKVDLTDAATGAPIGDWEPWLGAWAHLFSIRQGATEPMHAHPDDDSIVRAADSTSVTFDVLFPRAGRYGVWVQLQRKGVVITLPFVVDVQGWTAAP